LRAIKPDDISLFRLDELRPDLGWAIKELKSLKLAHPFLSDANCFVFLMPPAARGLFLKKPPPGPPQKLLIKMIPRTVG
jgi:hypothetical protein